MIKRYDLKKCNGYNTQYSKMIDEPFGEYVKVSDLKDEIKDLENHIECNISIPCKDCLDKRWNIYIIESFIRKFLI